jgi:FkbM family methyltransferase
MIARIRDKIRKDGISGAIKTVGRIVHHKVHQPDWDFEIVPSLLSKLVQVQSAVTIVQIGANVGNTGSDQLYGFLKEHCLKPECDGLLSCRAVMVEPVRYLFDQLSANYAGFRGVTCENAAIAETVGTRNFYRLREGIDLQANGLQPWAEQLGSFLPEQMASLWNHDPGNLELRRFVEANIVVEEVRCLSLHDLLAKHQLSGVDLLQIDTEGYDYQILRTIDFKRFTPRYINYERIHLKKDESRCRAMLVDQGYRLHDHGQDTLCEHTTGLSLGNRLCERVYCAWLGSIY